MRDGSTRDTTSANLDIVLDIVHRYNYDYDQDGEYDHIANLLNFRLECFIVKRLIKFQKSVATIPKTWQDAYGDTVKATASEVATCLNAALDHLGAGNGLRSWRENRTAIKRKQKRQDN